MRAIFFPLLERKQIRQRKLYSVFILNFIYDLLWLWLLLFAQRDFKSAQEMWKREITDPFYAYFANNKYWHEIIYDTKMYLCYVVVFRFLVSHSHGAKQSVEWEMISICARLVFHFAYSIRIVGNQ